MDAETTPEQLVKYQRHALFAAVGSITLALIIAGIYIYYKFNY